MITILVGKTKEI